MGRAWVGKMAGAEEAHPLWVQCRDGVGPLSPPHHRQQISGDGGAEQQEQSSRAR